MRYPLDNDILTLRTDNLLVRYPLDNDILTLRTDNLLVGYPLTDNDSIIYDDIDLRELFECTHSKFTVSGRSKQASKHRYTHVQCSHASVGLAQAHCNKVCIVLHATICSTMHKHCM